jgi:hypothetical protein
MLTTSTSVVKAEDVNLIKYMNSIGDEVLKY